MKPRTWLKGACAALVLVLPAAAQPTALTFSGSQSGEWFGSSVAGIGDVDGDGFDDWAIGAPYWSGPMGPTGRVQILGGPDGHLIRTLPGEAALDQYGAAVAAVGDVDGDSRGDLVIGAPGNGQGGAMAGKVHLVSGATGAVLRYWTGVAGARLGSSLAGAGDTNGDAIPDVAAGAPGLGGNSGAVYLWSGATGAVIHTWNGAATGDQFGFSLAFVGDQNQDGIPELVAGAPYRDVGTLIDAGRATILNPADGLTTWNRNGAAAGDLLGFSLAGPGDLTGDGRAEVLVGVPSFDGGALDAGRVELLSAVAGSLITAWDGTQSGENLGRTVANAGDGNGDGATDFAIAAPRFNGVAGASAGRVVIVSGSGLSVLRSYVGQHAGAEFGSALSGPADLDGNGFSDIVIGAPRYSGGAALNVGLVLGFPAEGAVGYGFGGGTAHTLSLAWSGGFSPGAVFSVIGQGAPPGANGLLFISPGSDVMPVSGPFGTATLLLDISDLLAIYWFPFASDAFGGFAVVGVLPPNAFLNGITLFTQAAIPSPNPANLRFSHGMQVTFGY